MSQNLENATAAEPPLESRRTAALRGLAYGVLLLTFTLAFFIIIMPMVIGAVPLTVLSNSMAPTMPIGSLAIVKPTEALVPHDNTITLTPDQIRPENDLSAINVGDVIVYQPYANDPTLVMHRAIKLETNWTPEGLHSTFITQGDNLSVADAPVSDYQVRGRVLYSLPYLGYVNNTLNAGEMGGKTTIAVVVAGYGLALYYLVFALRARRADNH